MTKLKVGDKLYDYSLKEYTVSKIGRQFFSMWSGNPVTLDQLRRINEIISENKQ